jgi:protein-disulfide isomerase
MASKNRVITVDLDKLNLLFMAFTVILAFVVGVLWQRVSALEGGGVSAPTASSKPSAAAPSKLDNLGALADAVGVDGDSFKSCYDENRYDGRIDADYQSGLKAGITGTPGNIVVNKKGEGWFIPGAVPYEQVKPVIEAALGNTDGTGVTGKMSADQFATVDPVTASDHMRGSLEDQVFLIEYSDFECPYCKSFHPTAQRILQDYDQVAWVYRHFPLESIHAKARPAALASECIAELGGNEAFWAFADEAFAD